MSFHLSLAREFDFQLALGAFGAGMNDALMTVA